ncbi:MAG: CPBP family intramembrane glutamic endopeptidase [Candidatus Acidiferrales bacterium]
MANAQHAREAANGNTESTKNTKRTQMNFDDTNYPDGERGAEPEAVNPSGANARAPGTPEDGEAGSNSAGDEVNNAALGLPILEANSKYEAAPEGFTERDTAQRFLPEDLRVPWGWLDLGLLIGVLFFGGVFLTLVAAIIFRSAGINLQHIPKTSPVNSVFLIGTQAVIDLGAMAYLAAQMHLRFGRPFWRTIGWRPLETGTVPRGLAVAGYLAGGFLLALVVQAAAAAHPPHGPVPIEALFQDRLSAVLMIFMGVLIAPVVEETLFRGYLYPVLARSWGVATSVVVTGVLFGWLHSFQLGGAWWQVTLLMLVGILFTYVRAKTGTVTSSFLLHVSYNSFQFFAFLVASHGLRILPHMGQ